MQVRTKLLSKPMAAASLAVKVRTPRFAAIAIGDGNSKGNTFADMPLIQAALGSCYSCADRQATVWRTVVNCKRRTRNEL